MKAIATIGASASGKSFWTRAFIAEREALGERWVELNKDDLRREILTLRGTPPSALKAALIAWSYDPAGADETEMKALLMARLSDALKSNASGAVFSNTNLDGGAQARAQLATLGADPACLETRLFPLSFNECVSRDQHREYKVGTAVIAEQFAKLAALGLGFPELPAPPPPKPAF